MDHLTDDDQDFIFWLYQEEELCAAKYEAEELCP